MMSVSIPDQLPTVELPHLAKYLYVFNQSIHMKRELYNININVTIKHCG